MSADPKEVIELINLAFQGVKLGSGVSLHEADVIDDYGSDEERMEARAGDEQEDWRRISEVDIAAHQYVLCFMDAEGLRFHWPAWMCFTLRHYGTSESASTDSIVYSICRFAVDHNMRVLLSDEQRNAIIEFLETCLNLGDWLDIDQIPEAVEAWRGDTESRRRLKRKLEFDDAVNKEYMQLVSEDSFLSDPDIICQAANGQLLPEQQDQYFQQMMHLRQKATQTVAKSINSFGHETLCYCTGEEVRVGDNIQSRGGQEGIVQHGRVVAVAGQVDRADESVPIPDWGFIVEDRTGELIHWDEADEDLQFLDRGGNSPTS